MKTIFIALSIIIALIFVLAASNAYTNHINRIVSSYEKMTNTPPLSQTWDILNIGSVTDDCYSKSPKKCLEYSNCGLCKGKCTPGDVNGPFFDDCDCNTNDWKYSNYYDKYIFGEHDILGTTSYDAYKKFPPRKYVQTLM